MRLKQIEINGFKSFGKKSTLSFTVPVTGIVGPNGSGKSNVVESFRFVLGEQSIKSMRGKSGADMIFRGGGSRGAASGNGVGSSSSTAPKLSRASVAITFDNADKVFELVPFEEVTFMREIFADGTSRYTVNGTEIRLKQMAELLSAVHIGTSSHHIISQGEADGILRANARERREILEDALGLKVYHFRIRESENKLAKALDALKDVQSLRRELAPHLSFLKKQVEKAEKGKALRDELQGLWATYLLAEKSQLKKEDGRIADATDVVTRQRQQYQAQLDALPVDADKESQQLLVDITAEKQHLLRVEQQRRQLEQRTSRLDGMIAMQRQMIQQQANQAHAVHAAHAMTGATQLRVAVQPPSHGNHAPEPGIVFTIAEYQQLLTDLSNFITELRSSTDISGTIETLERFAHVVGKLKQRGQHAAPSVSSAVEAPSAAIVHRTDNGAAGMAHAIHETALELEALEKELRVLVEEEQDVRDRILHKEMLREQGLATSQKATETRYELRNGVNQCESELQVLAMAKRAFLERKASFEQELKEAGFLFGVQFFHTIESAVPFDEATLVPSVDIHAAKRAVDRLKIRVEEHAGIGNEVFAEYENAKERDEFLSKEMLDIETSVRNLEGIIVELKKILDEKFTHGVQVINERFGDFFKTMFGGGSAFLSITVERKRRRKNDDESIADAEAIAGGEAGDPSAEITDESDDRFFERGIEVHVNVPEKKVKDLQMLSGGERSLVSIALLFAVSQVNPPPFLVLDETDAALDESNSRKYGDMIEKLSEFSQLIVVTHNRETMSRAQVLYGVTLGADSASKLLSIRFDEAVKVAK